MNDQLKEEVIERLVELECEISYEMGYPCDSLDELLQHNELSEKTKQLLTKLGIEI